MHGTLNAMPSKMNPFRVVKISSSGVAIEDGGISSPVFKERGTWAPTLLTARGSPAIGESRTDYILLNDAIQNAPKYEHIWAAEPNARQYFRS